MCIYDDVGDDEGLRLRLDIRRPSKDPWTVWKNWPLRVKFMVVAFSILAMASLVGLYIVVTMPVVPIQRQGYQKKLRFPNGTVIIESKGTTTEKHAFQDQNDFNPNVTLGTTPGTPPFIPVTKKPIPINYKNVSADNILQQLGLDPVFAQMDCDSGDKTRPTFMFNVTVQGHVWYGLGKKKTAAKVVSARNACFAMFNMTWPNPIDPPILPCKK